LSADVEERLVFFGCLFFAIILHEISHGIVALFFGDDTAKRAGRITLNPIPHIDPFGSIVLPALLTISGFGAFGWAKPVPVNPAKLRNPRREMLFVGLAGPFSNFVLMALAAVTARAAYGAYTGDASRIADLPLIIQVLLFFALGNLLLGLFNLLPIPPLDGSSLIERVLPSAWLPGWYRFRPYGILVLLLLGLSTNVFGRLFGPFIDGLFDFIVQ
jgi:Zn-dependent protease